MSHRYRALSVVAAAIALAACARAIHPDVAVTDDPAINSELERLRSATRAFKNLDSAVAAGYPREVADCLVHEHHGAMGYHHVNRSYLTPTLNIEHPQILLYERAPDGGYKLNGVEFIIPYRLYSRDSVAPVFMKQQLHHEDNLNIWYLHVWAWTNNANGVFANFNPDVVCPAGKVYRPFSRDAGAP